MNPNYAVYTHINSPVEDVFKTVVAKETFARFFMPDCNADLIEGTTVSWGEDCDVQVLKVVENERIEISFKPSNMAIAELKQGDKRDYDAKVVFYFEAADIGGTMVTICEYGWQDDRRSMLQSYGHCAGWQDMLCTLKAHMDHGIDLRNPPGIRPNYVVLWGN